MGKNVSILQGYSIKLNEYYEKRDALYEQWEETLHDCECFDCELYQGGIAERTVDRFKECDCVNQSKMIEASEALDQVNDEITDFVINVYSKEVYNFFSTKKPQLIRNSTGKTYSWEEAFGMKFEDVPKTLRYSLIGLIENTGRYRLK